MSHRDEKKYSKDGGHESVPHYLIISSGMDPVGCKGGASPWKIPISLIRYHQKHSFVRCIRWPCRYSLLSSRPLSGAIL